MTMPRSFTRTIALDARTLAYTGSSQRGIGHFVVNHLTSLAQAAPDWEFVLLFDQAYTNEAVNRLTQFPNVRADAFGRAGRPDLYYIPDPLSIMLGFDSPFSYLPGVPRSVLIHDLIPLVYPAHYLDKWDHGHRMGYLKRVDELTAAKAQYLTNSCFTRQEVHRLLKLPLSTMVPVMAGLNASLAPSLAPQAEIKATLAKHGLDAPYFLVVGSVETYKRFDLTVEAFLQVQGRLPCRLVVAGSLDDPWKQAYQEMIQDMRVTGVTFTGFLPREELEHLYAAAVCLVHPAEYEGFGFPVLEAMARGCPVIACQAASIPEVAGDAAFLIAPGSGEALTAAMHALATRNGLRCGLRARGLVQAERFSWDAVARRSIEAWQKHCFDAFGEEKRPCPPRVST